MNESTFESQVKNNTKKLSLWTALWTTSMAFATFGPKFFWNENILITAVVVAINAAFGLGMVLMNIKYINALDDLLKKIHLEAMAIALGVGVVGGLSYSLLDITNLIPFDAEIGFLVIFIGLTYLTAIFIGQKKYK